MVLADKFNRHHTYLRISLTDKCNLNCLYCSPKSNIDISKRHDDILRYEEIIRIVNIFVTKFGFTKIRLTGGEPFIKKNIDFLLEGLNNIKMTNPFEIAATTNGTLLNGNLTHFKSIGLDRLNFSIDSLNSENYKRITGKNDLNKVLESLKKAELAGFDNIKINTVIIKDLNDHEILDFIDFIANTKYNLRFIEYMPFSNNAYNSNKLISSKEIFDIISQKYILEHIPSTNSVAKNYSISGFSGTVSFISSISEHFCGSCNRLRLTSDGELKLCLFSSKTSKFSLKNLIRSGFSDDEIADRISKFLCEKELQHPDLDELIQLKNNEMISIGG